MRKPFSELVLDISRDMIDATPFEEPDPRWRFKDGEGHAHKWKIKGDLSSMPTCSRKTEVAGYYPDGSEIIEVIYLCLKCGEEIFPRWRHVYFKRFVPGPTNAFLDGVFLSKSETEIVQKVFMARLHHVLR